MVTITVGQGAPFSGEFTLEVAQPSLSPGTWSSQTTPAYAGQSVCEGANYRTPANDQWLQSMRGQQKSDCGWFTLTISSVTTASTKGGFAPFTNGGGTNFTGPTYVVHGSLDNYACYWGVSPPPASHYNVKRVRVTF
jgi:hypothetical protein